MITDSTGLLEIKESLSQVDLYYCWFFLFLIMFDLDMVTISLISPLTNSQS